MDFQESSSGYGTVLCCVCSCSITPNPSNMCVSCLRNNVDITEGINRQMVIYSCRSCGRFLCPPWQNVALESKELLAACLRKIPGLSKLRVIDAVWIWTEPHSMRLKIKITVQQEVMGGAILQQAAVVEFAIKNQQCKNCEASYAQGVWHAVVQVRQRVTHKRTFFLLEQLLLKHRAHSDCINIVTFADGMDFYFTRKRTRYEIY
jgi:nonsense-mediated mRNA decay protein 3